MFREQEKTVHALKASLKESDEALKAARHFINTFQDKDKKSLIENGDIEGRGITISEVIHEARRTVRAILSVRSPRISHLSNSKLNELQASATALASTVRDFDQARKGLLSENKPYRLHPHGRVIALISNEEIYTFGNLADAISNSLESLRAATLGLAIAATDAEGEIAVEAEISIIAARISEELKAAQEATQAAIVAHEDAGEKLEEVEKIHQKILTSSESIKEEASAQSEAAATTVSELESKLTAATDHEIEIGKKKEIIASLVDEAEEDRESLANFSNELDSVNGKLSDFIQRAEEDEKKRSDFILQVQDLVARAEGMVSGATVAGLAKAFADERETLETSMKNAMKWFNIGIISLFLVTILLAAYVFELPLTIGGIALSGTGTTDKLGDEITIAGVISRTIILMAPFWLTLFSARRYRNLFDLRQQYSHKYNLAFSIDGFRKQAPNYGEELAAWVFHEISQPPTNSNSKKLGDNPIPSLEALVNAAVARTTLFKDRSTEAP